MFGLENSETQCEQNYPPTFSGPESKTGELTFFVQRILRSFAFWNVHDSMNVETDFFRVRRPVFVAEAVGISAVHGGHEGVVARTGGFLEDLLCA